MRFLREKLNRITFFISILLLVPLLLVSSIAARETESQDIRDISPQRLEWRAGNMPSGASPESWLHVKLLAINDFHGQISAGKTVSGRRVGSAAVLASYLKAAEIDDATLIIDAGDQIGASPPSSALLQDEPSIMFLNMLANQYCSESDRMNPRCNVVATVGNHELDEGKAEMLRLIYGGNYVNGPFLEAPYTGAHFPYVCANMVDSKTGKPILPPYAIKKVNGMPIAFIGAILKDTPTIVTASGVAGLSFLDEAESINKYIPELRAQHVRTIIAIIHQGGSFNSKTQKVEGPIVDIVRNLDDEIDVVISGHSHTQLRDLLPNKNGHEILVTQAYSAGTAYADIDLEIDRATKDVVAKSAAVYTTWADEGPGLTPDPQAADLTAQAEAVVAPLVNKVEGIAAVPVTRTQNAAGESALGNLIADAQRAAMNTDFAFMNPGGIRADLAAGDITWGELFTIQPFSNYLVKMELTGQQIYGVLNQQFTTSRMLQISGLTYSWANNKVVQVLMNGLPIDPNAVFTVTVNNFLADGGDGFTTLKGGTKRVVGPVDLDALVSYIQTFNMNPISYSIDGRVTKQ